MTSGRLAGWLTGLLLASLVLVADAYARTAVDASDTGQLRIAVETVPHDGRGVAVADMDVTGVVLDQTLHDGVEWYADLVDGHYAVAITPRGGGRLAALSCDDTDSARASATDRDAGTINAWVETGEVVRCRAQLVHDAPATVVLANDVLGPRLDPFETWQYDGLGPFGPRTLGARDAVSVPVWPDGALDVHAMGEYPHYRLESVACDDGASATPSGGEPGQQRATFGLDAGETVRCTFGWRPRALVSAGPLRRINTSPALACSVAHKDDAQPSFFADFACGTFVSAGGTTYGPNVPAGPGVTDFTAVERTDPSGAGTRADPLRVETTAEVGDTGLRLRQVDTYVIGEEAYRTAVTVTNAGTQERDGQLYRAADCYLQDSDLGYGDVDAETGAVACRAADTGDDGQTVPGARIEQWYPLTPGSRHLEAHFNTVWGFVAGGTPFDDTCACDALIDNGAGLSWAYSLAPGQSVTHQHLTTFSPAGRRPLLVSERALAPTVRAGGQAGYEIAVENPNVAGVGLPALTATLPPGFTYVAGSTEGAGEPQLSGRTVTWMGALSVPAGGALVLRFAAEAPVAAGDYDSEAAADAADPYVAVPTGPTARVTVLADTAAPSAVLRAPADGARFRQGEAVAADFSCADDAGGTGIASCTGTVADGAGVSTATPGTHAFEVVAVDRAGNRTTVRHTYTVEAPPPVAPAPAPTAQPGPEPEPPPAPPTPPAPPAPPPPAVVKGEQAAPLGLPTSRRCVSRRRFRIRLRAPAGTELKSARVWVAGKRVKVARKGGRLTAMVDLRGLRKGRFTVLVRAVATDGRKLREQRRYRTCAKRRAP